MKHFVSLLTFVLVLCSALPAAAYVRPYNNDIKLGTQVVMEKQTITTPILADADRVKTTYAGATAATAVTLTSFTAQPDVPRNITITPTGTTTDIESCVIVVTGTDFHGDALTENITFAANDSALVAGTKAFKTVTSVVWPADCESGAFGATWTIGVGDVLGLKRCMAAAGDVVFAKFNGAFEGTRGTATASATVVASNTYDPTGTLDGAKDVEVFFLQNFVAGCQP